MITRHAGRIISNMCKHLTFHRPDLPTGCSPLAGHGALPLVQEVAPWDHRQGDVWQGLGSNVNLELRGR